MESCINFLRLRYKNKVFTNFLGSTKLQHSQYDFDEFRKNSNFNTYKKKKVPAYLYIFVWI